MGALMAVDTTQISVRTNGPGTYEITRQVQDALEENDIENGIACVHCRHTSCSLVLMENADPSARADLEAYLNRLVPENDPSFTHTTEGADDMPAHIKMALTRSNESIPISGGDLVLGTWQGIFLWEHRRGAHQRKVFLSFVGE